MTGAYLGTYDSLLEFIGILYQETGEVSADPRDSLFISHTVNQQQPFIALALRKEVVNNAATYRR